MEVAIHSRRQIISGLMLTLFSGLAPLGANSAIARNGGEGRGNGSSRGGDSSGDRGGSGKDGGSRNGDSRGNGNSNNRGRSSISAAETDTGDSRSRSGAVSADRSEIRVRHGNGIAEEVNDRGRYVMRDRSGRTIVNRTATKSDLDRLRSLVK